MPGWKNLAIIAGVVVVVLFVVYRWSAARKAITGSNA